MKSPLGSRWSSRNTTAHSPKRRSSSSQRFMRRGCADVSTAAAFSFSHHRFRSPAQMMLSLPPKFVRLGRRLIRELNGRKVMKRLLGLAYVAALVFTAACGRTDAGITTDVKAKLAADEAVKASQVNVDTHDRVVTLTGSVDSLVAKSRAVALTREADGVRDVIDNIRVNETIATSGRDVDDVAADKIREGADATADGSRRAADATAHGIRKGANAVANGTEKAGR